MGQAARLPAPSKFYTSPLPEINDKSLPPLSQLPITSCQLLIVAGPRALEFFHLLVDPQDDGLSLLRAGAPVCRPANPLRQAQVGRPGAAQIEPLAHVRRAQGGVFLIAGCNH